jgi:hypothetical protein
VFQRVVERLRRVRFIYLLTAFAALVAGAVLLARAGGEPDDAAEPAPLPRPVRECVRATGSAATEQPLVVTRSATVELPVSATATGSAPAEGGHVEATVTVRSTVAQTAEATVQRTLRVRTRARGRACARGDNADEARLRAQAVARERGSRKARRELPAALREERRAATDEMAAEAEAQARERADEGARAALPEAQAEADRRAARLAQERAEADAALRPGPP